MGSDFAWESPDSPITTDDFVIYNGMRYVKPYFFEFIAHVKKRWDRKTITKLFAEEFRQRPLEYYIEAVKAGRLRVNGKLVDDGYIVSSSQTLNHFVHRHEPPVMGEPVRILELNDDVVTIWKPPSVPVHPCGQYRKNTVLGILQAEHNLQNLYPIHRLDRLVSGLLILARNARTADKFRQEIEDGTVHKVYVAKVDGVFPEEVELNATVVYDPKEGKSTIQEKDDASAQPGKGKSACTRFKRLYTNGKHSIVECIPLTGRTHQIRVHLQYLGHPIANDALYSLKCPPKRTLVGTNAERAARTAVQLDKDSKEDLQPNELSSNMNIKRRKVDEDTSKCDVPVFEESSEINNHGSVCAKNEFSAGNDVKFTVDPMCTHCPKLMPSGYEGNEDGLWLHCKRYSGKGWEYECPLPSWAVFDVTPGT